MDHRNRADSDRGGKQSREDPQADVQPQAGTADVLLAELVALVPETQRVFVLEMFRLNLEQVRLVDQEVGGPARGFRIISCKFGGRGRGKRCGASASGASTSDFSSSSSKNRAEKPSAIPH